jgi:predicted RND superfamily exporter protein
MPAWIAIVEHVHPLAPAAARGGRPTGLVAAPFARLIVGWPRTAVVVSVAVSLASAALVVRFSREPLEYDFSKLGSRIGVKTGVGFWSRKVDAVMQSYQTPTVVLTDAPEKAVDVAAALEETKRSEGPKSTIDTVATLQRLAPGDQQRKLVLLREIFDLLSPRVIAHLPADVRPLAQRLKEKTVLAEVTLADVPERLTGLFKEKDGSSGKLVAVYPTLSTTAVNGKAQIEFARAIRRTALSADPTAQVAGQVILTSDIIAMITEDGALAAMLSFLAVASLTLLVLRSMRDAAWVIGSLCLGTLWMGGSFGLLDLRFNFVNFAVLPITFGIGIDYAVNLYQRYRQTGSVEESLAASGGAVALCSTTTIIGYAALLLADNMAIHSFGLTAVLGEITCLSAALFALPAFLAWRDQRRRAAVAPDPLPAAAGEQRATGT